MAVIRTQVGHDKATMRMPDGYHTYGACTAAIRQSYGQYGALAETWKPRSCQKHARTMATPSYTHTRITPGLCQHCARTTRDMRPNPAHIHSVSTPLVLVHNSTTARRLYSSVAGYEHYLTDFVLQHTHQHATHCLCFTCHVRPKSQVGHSTLGDTHTPTHTKHTNTDSSCEETADNDMTTRQRKTLHYKPVLNHPSASPTTVRMATGM